MELGAKFWLALFGIVLGVAVGGFLLFALIGYAWYTWGIFGTFLFFGGILLIVAYIYDRRAQKRYTEPL